MPEPAVAPVRATNPFIDVSKLRLKAANDIGMAKKVLTHVPTRKPHKQEFIRVHPDPAYRLEVGLLELKEEDRRYLVGQDLHGEILSDVQPTRLVTTISRQGALFLWPLRLPDPEGRQNAWHTSALEGADYAVKTWTKISANMAAGMYDVHVATAEIPEPTWPEEPFEVLLEKAFKDAYIDSWDHPVLLKLRGEA